MTWPDRILVPRKLPSELSLKVISPSKSMGGLYSKPEWTVLCPEMDAAYTVRGDGPEEGIVMLIDALDMIYGSGKAPICPQMRALAASHEVLKTGD